MAGITYSDGGTKRTISGVTYQDGSSKRTVQNIWYGDGGTKRLVFAAYKPVSVTVGDTSISSDTHGTGNLTVGSTKLTASGGTGSYTYTATRISGSAEITAAISSSGTATFRHNVIGPHGYPISAVFRLTASDGTSSAYKDVTVTTTSLA